MRAHDPDNPRVQDQSLRGMKVVIWMAVAVALLMALACGLVTGFVRFPEFETRPATNEAPQKVSE